MQSHVSTQIVECPSFCFPADLVFQERASCECCILKSVDPIMNIISTHCMHILLWLECD